MVEPRAPVAGLAGDQAEALLAEYEAVAKLIDIPANALFHHLSVDGLSVDLSYTPPFGSPWDAVQLAAHDWTRQARTVPA